MGQSIKGPMSALANKHLTLLTILVIISPQSICLRILEDLRHSF